MVSKSDPPWVSPNKIMLNYKFDKERMRIWQVWAARWRDCPQCHAAAYTPCKNLADLKSPKVPEGMERDCRYPHHQRIDYALLMDGLKYRGFS